MDPWRIFGVEEIVFSWGSPENKLSSLGRNVWLKDGLRDCLWASADWCFCSTMVLLMFLELFCWLVSTNHHLRGTLKNKHIFQPLDCKTNLSISKEACWCPWFCFLFESWGTMNENIQDRKIVVLCCSCHYVWHLEPLSGWSWFFCLHLRVLLKLRHNLFMFGDSSNDLMLKAALLGFA